MRMIIYTIMLAFATVLAAPRANAQTSGCVGIASLTVVIEDCVGIDDMRGNMPVQVSPNPFQDAFNVQLPEKMHNQPCHLTLADLSGRTLYGQQLIYKNILTVPAANLPAGVYILHIQTELGNYQGRLVKE